jgi:hypothetical protein
MQDIATNEETLKKMKKSYNDHATFRFRGWVLNCFFFVYMYLPSQKIEVV